MKKVAVGLLVAFLCSFSFAGTQYIKYACGCMIENGTCRGNKDQIATEAGKCPSCQRNEDMCNSLWENADRNDEGAKKVYDEYCLPNSN